MSKDEQQYGPPESPLDTAMTIVSARGGAAAEGKYVTEVTISEPSEASGSEAERKYRTDVTIPMGDTAHTELMESPPTSGNTMVGELQPGDRIERYVIVKRLGKGGMGSVYLARHETLGAFRAIKVLSGELYQRGKEFTRRFIQEAKIASSISDPNIVNVLDVGEDPERSFCYIIMEYVDGGTVRDVLRRIPRLSELHSVVIAEAVAVALNAAAEQKIVHRDIKPDNIMLTRRGEVKLADLGIAKNTDDNVQLTKSHVMMGTPAYLAPEQAQDAHSVDVRADIYSLGATLFEMLTGRIPYPGKSTYDILRKLVSEPIPDPRSVIDTISAPTARLVMRMLAKQAKQRPGSAEELLREIHKLNFLPADLDTKKCIRELLEQAGEGNYSAASYTSATGNPVSSWFARHILLRAETVLRKVPLFASILEVMRRDIILSYVILAMLALLLITLPVAWFLIDSRSRVGAADFDPAPVAASSVGAGARNSEPPPVEPVEVKAETPLAKPVESVIKTETPRTKPVKPLETAEKKPAPAVRKSEPVALPKLTTESKPAAVSARPREVLLIGFSADVSPAGALVVLKNESGRIVESRNAPPERRMEFRVPAGQYKLEVSSPGFKSAERKFPLSESRAISSLKIDLEREVASCRIEFYGLPKLLAYLAEEGVELSVDDGEWKKVRTFPLDLELSRAEHTVAIRGKGIQPVRQSWSIAPDQARSTVEIYLQEKEAVIEIVPAVKGKVMINIFGIWEDLRDRVAVPPFKAVVLKWRVGDGAEQVVDIPELPPESVRRITLEEHKKAKFAGAEEFAEGEASVRSGDYAAAVEKLNAAAGKGNPEAMYLLGRLAEQGKGRWFASDRDALAEYRKAADAPYEYAKAQFKMGDFCENGRGGLDVDLKKAVDWYKKAAAQKDPEALFRMAMACRDGDGDEPIDYLKMFEFVLAAAELGHLEAQYQTGYCYENGIGVPINVERAKFWYAKAAERGHDNARSRSRALEGIK